MQVAAVEDLVPVQAQVWQLATSLLYPSSRAMVKVVEAAAGTKFQALLAAETLAPLTAPGG